MSLFGTINNSSTALQAAQLGLQTVSNNIANSDTEGYVRQRLEQTTPEPYRSGNLILGQGVRPNAIVQQIDKALAERMWNAGSDLAAAELRERVLSDVEALLNDLNGGGLSSDLDAMNAALHDWSVEPNDPSLRQYVVLTAQSLTSEINHTYTRARDYQSELDAQLNDTVSSINALAQKVAKLNLRITTLEGGRTLGSDATGLRDERYRTIEQLSELIKVRVQEQESGSVSLFIGGDYLVAETYSRDLRVTVEGEKNAGKVVFDDTDAIAQITGGRLKSMTEGRDTLLGGVLGGLDQLAQDLLREFNVVHSQGQADRGYESLTGVVPLNATAALNESGLQWDVEGGSFEVLLVDEQGRHISRTPIEIRSTGTGGSASTVQSIIEDIDAIDGVSAEVLPSGEIHIESNVPGVRFTFGTDTSEFLAAAGLNVFFAGHDAETIQVTDLLQSNPEHLAISRGGVGADTDTLNQMVDLIDTSIARNSGNSIRDGYTQVISQLSQTAANQKAELDGLAQYYATLNSEHLAITGVNLDEEAIRMISYQRTFQAASRVIATANEMLEILTSL